MRIERNGECWGQMTVEEQHQQVLFRAVGTSAGYGEILRVWGLRDGAQPLLIGVAEPKEHTLCAERMMSKQYLASVGYWPELPTSYAAGMRTPELCHTQEDILIVRARQDKQVQTVQQEGKEILSCVFDKHTAFPLAFAACVCTVSNGRAQLVWDTKKGCPVRTAQ